MAAAAELVRAFIAIEPSDDVIAKLMELQKQLANSCPARSVKWTGREQMHLTLKFLGSVDAAQLEELRGALSDACAGIAPFPLAAARLGCFPNLRCRASSGSAQKAAWKHWVRFKP